MRTTTNLCAILLALSVAGFVQAQTPDDFPSPSDRLPIRPLLDDGQMSPPADWLNDSNDLGDFDDEEPLETDRDSFTPATTTVTRHRFIVESAYSFIDRRDRQDSHSFPEFVGRYGLADWFELRFGANYEVGGGGNAISGGGSGGVLNEPGKIERESQVTYGFKVSLTQQDSWKPRSAVILQGASPTSGPEATSQFIGTYVLGWQFSNGWTWDSAIRYATAEAEGDRHGAWAPSTVLKVPLAERWNAHAEYFGITSVGLAEARHHHYFSPGMHYLITNDLEIGVRVGWGLNEQASNFFSNVGFGWRF